MPTIYSDDINRRIINFPMWMWNENKDGIKEVRWTTELKQHVVAQVFNEKRSAPEDVKLKLAALFSRVGKGTINQDDLITQLAEIGYEEKLKTGEGVMDIVAKHPEWFDNFTGEPIDQTIIQETKKEAETVEWVI